EGLPSEAAVGARYLMARGVPESALVREERSRHTLENLRFHRSAARPEGLHTALVTSRLHLARSSALASGLRIPHQLCAAEELWSLSPREIPRLLAEAFFLHWYWVGRNYARWTGNRRMLEPIS
ncbi:YdcF family protein, partial [Methylacidimicrobium cyclopophantes]|uniref:YdcF family protein n=1 Tax=Methylacidimicrobium cyclopophantes TaxID=1041766 RepID=UPI001159A8A7